MVVEPVLCFFGGLLAALVRTHTNVRHFLEPHESLLGPDFDEGNLLGVDGKVPHVDLAKRWPARANCEYDDDGHHASMTEHTPLGADYGVETLGPETFNDRHEEALAHRLHGCALCCEGHDAPLLAHEAGVAGDATVVLEERGIGALNHAFDRQLGARGCAVRLHDER